MKLIHLFTLSATALALVACGASSNNPSDSADALKPGEVQFYGAKVAAAEADLPKCDSTKAGQLFYVLEASEFRFCTLKGYVTIDLAGADGEDGEDGANGVDGTDGTNGTNGKDGATGSAGTDGTDGVDGSSCSVKTNTDGTKTISCTDKTTATVSDGQGCSVKTVTGGYELTCGTSPTVVVKNGVDGEDGANGTDGINCTVTDDKQGTITQTCGNSVVSWPKAVCGAKAYEPLTHFCDVRTSSPMASWSDHCLVPGNCGSFMDTRETPAKVYKWTKIGDQIWMAENLNYATASGSWCKSEADNSAVTTNTSYCDTYGRSYLFSTAKTACPAGWHLPSDDEWKTLEVSLGMNTIEAANQGWRGTNQGAQLKSASTLWVSGTTTFTNTVGFSAEPGGYYYGDKNSIEDIGKFADFWTATIEVASKVWYRQVVNTNLTVERKSLNQTYGLSVRCVKDAI